MEAAQSDALVIYGATGDLAFKQIFPALLGLVRDEGMAIPIVGVARSLDGLEGLRSRVRQSLAEHGLADAAGCEKLLSLMRFVGGDYTDPATFEELHRALGGSRSPLHYLAVPPSLFEAVALCIAKTRDGQHPRLVIEKPFGHDRASAARLNCMLRQCFEEEDIFRIDHFLGKEPVQNLIYTRFANPMFEPVWNRSHVRSMQITMAETFGILDRGRFYDATGACRDVLQNHLLQIVAHLAMDPPTGTGSEAIRDQKASLLKAIRPIAAGDVVRGQYRGYREAKDVDAGSTTETYAAVRLFIESWRWEGVPIYIRTGKMLPVTATEVTVEFRRPPRDSFNELVLAGSAYMRFRLGPDMAIGMGLRVKQPGDRMAGIDKELMLAERAASFTPPYQRLLGEAIKGRGELFGRQDIVDAQWRIVEPILEDAAPIHTYEPGSWGPSEAAQLIGGDGPWVDPRVVEGARA